MMSRWVNQPEPSEEALRTVEERHRTALDAAQLGTWTYEVASGLMHLDARARDQLGIDREDVPLPDLLVRVHPDDSTSLHRALAAALDPRSKDQLVIEFRVSGEDGARRWLSIYGRVKFEGEGDAEQAIRGVGTIQDITQRKLAEEQLRRNRDIFYHLIQDNPFGVYLVDADFRLRQVSLGAQEVFKNVRPLLGRDFAEVLRLIWAEPFASEAIGRFRHTLETGEPYAAPATVQRRQDIPEVEAYDWRIDRVTLPDGRHAVVCYFYDLSERQRWDAALRESEERFRQLAESMPQLVWTADANGRIDYYNHRISEYGGAKQGSDGQWSAEAILHPDDLPRTVAAWHAAVNEGGIYQIEHRIRMADGAFRWHLGRAYPGRDAGGKVVKWFGTTTDIDDQKRAQEILEQTVQERTAKLRETIGELEHLSYSITHDLRAPLRSMHAFGEILIDEYHGGLDEVGRDYLRRIVQAAGRLDSLITDALHYTKAVGAEFVLEPIDPGVLIREIVESYPQLRRQRAQIEVEDSLPHVLGNRGALTQCFSNLLDNATKFVAAGTTPRVRVRAQLREGFVRLWFEDNGIGIPQDQLERVFGMFQQLNRAYEGTGIGLALVQKVVHRMQGRVGVESEPGTGSRFWLELRPGEAQP